MTTDRQPRRLAILVTHPIQYFSPLYRRLSSEPGIELTVLYCSRAGLDEVFDPGFNQVVKWDIPLLEGYRYVFMPNLSASKTGGGFFSYVNPSVVREIWKGEFDAVWLHGHNSVTHVVAFLTALLCRVPIMMRSETHLHLARPAAKRWLRRPLMSVLFRGCSALLAIGTANEDFYRHHRVRRDRIFRVPYAVDNEFFQERSAIAAGQRVELRRSLDIPGDERVILFASKFIPRKRPLDLVQAFELIRKKGVKATLLMVGAGHLEEELRTYVSEHRIDQVIFTGFRNQSELPNLFAISDLFVLPSEDEPWGLVINEAMNAGLPIVAASCVGAASDLVVSGRNGFQYAAGDIPALAHCLQRVLETPALSESFGKSSLEIIRSWGLDECVAGTKKALDYVHGH